MALLSSGGTEMCVCRCRDTGVITQAVILILSAVSSAVIIS